MDLGLASGTPVVVARVGEVANYVTDGEIAFVANLGDQEALVAALDAVLGAYSAPSRTLIPRQAEH